MSEGPYLDFERPIAELQKKISDMRDFSAGESIELGGEIASLEKKLDRLRVEIYTNLSRWQRVQIARHPKRPYTLDYIEQITTEFVEIHGDRSYGDDKAMVGGFARIDGEPVMIIGQQKGRDTKQKLYRNFGMAHPEGYRKARRLFYLAEKFALPIVVLIDTPGAFPGIAAEERGQAEAIAKNIQIMFELKTPIVVVIIGEGASGGALGIGIGDRVLVMEYAWYSVISPEGCAAILWKDATRASEAAEALKPTSEDLVKLGIVDRVVPEPTSGAHNDPVEAARLLKADIIKCLNELKGMPLDILLSERMQKYRKMGEFSVS
ncbi:MAG: acetyl-CoA carboxylase carboxyltransferase subunit alpha [candidate division Zixibacteria bacterium]|nr:acetyl-CoA carboxylase carboxyltransferase subunit alpha [candidate division Zixibacteria bacterium]